MIHWWQRSESSPVAIKMAASPADNPKPTPRAIPATHPLLCGNHRKTMVTPSDFP